MAEYKHSLYISGIKQDLKDNELKEILEREICVENIRRLNATAALVLCCSQEHAEKGIEIFDGTLVHGCQIQVAFKTETSKSAKSFQQNPPTLPSPNLPVDDLDDTNLERHSTHSSRLSDDSVKHLSTFCHDDQENSGGSQSKFAGDHHQDMNLADDKVNHIPSHRRLSTKGSRAHNPSKVCVKSTNPVQVRKTKHTKLSSIHGRSKNLTSHRGKKSTNTNDKELQDAASDFDEEEDVILNKTLIYSNSSLKQSNLGECMKHLNSSCLQNGSNNELFHSLQQMGSSENHPSRHKTPEKNTKTRPRNPKNFGWINLSQLERLNLDLSRLEPFVFHREKRQFSMEQLRYIYSQKHAVKAYEADCNVTIKVFFNESCLQVQGNRENVLRVVESLTKLISAFVVQTVPLTNVCYAVMESIEAPEIIHEFKQYNLFAGWHISANSLSVCSNRLQAAKKASNVILGLITEGDYPQGRSLSLTEKHILASEYMWKNRLYSVAVEYQCKTLVTHFDESEKKIKFAIHSTKGLSFADKVLSECFALFLPVKKSLKIPSSLASLVSKNQDLVTEICSVKGVNVYFADLITSGKLKIESNSVESLEEFADKFSNFLLNKFTATIGLSKPGIAHWLESQTGKDRLLEIQHLFNVLLQVSKGNSVFSSFSRSSRSRSKLERFPKVIQQLSKPATTGTLSTDDKTSTSCMPSKIVSLFSVFRSFFNKDSLTKSASAISGAVAVSAIVGAASIFVQDTGNTDISPARVVLNTRPVTPETIAPEILAMVEVVKGDISSVQTDAVVSSQGVIKAALETACGTTIVSGHQCVQTKSGSNLSIYHSDNTLEWNMSTINKRASVLKDLVEKSYLCLKDSDVVSYPAIGTGNLKYPPDLVASTMIETVLTCLNTYHWFSTEKRVKFVIHPTDSAVYQAFMEELARYQPQPSAILQQRKVLPKVVIPSHEPTGEITVEVIGFKDDDVQNAVKLLLRDVDQCLVTCDMKLSPLRELVSELTQAEVDKIYKMSRSCNTEVTFKLEDNDILIEGLQADAFSMRDEIQQVLHRKATAVPLGLPSHWEDENMDTDLLMVALHSHSSEYQRVKTKFLETSGAYSRRLSISEILRVQNATLYQQFEAQKEKIANDMITDWPVTVGRELWHGTDCDSVTKICTYEFNRSYCGKNATVYGKGSYFSTTSEYSIQYCSQSQPTKSIILAQVATGRYQLGNSSTDRSNLPERFHSTVNKLDSPTIFVVYHDAAAYPTYVIKFSLTPHYLAGWI